MKFLNCDEHARVGLAVARNEMRIRILSVLGALIALLVGLWGVKQLGLLANAIVVGAVAILANLLRLGILKCGCHRQTN